MKTFSVWLWKSVYQVSALMNDILVGIRNYFIYHRVFPGFVYQHSDDYFYRANYYRMLKCVHVNSQARLSYDHAPGRDGDGLLLVDPFHATVLRRFLHERNFLHKSASYCCSNMASNAHALLLVRLPGPIRTQEGHGTHACELLLNKQR